MIGGEARAAALEQWRRQRADVIGPQGKLLELLEAGDALAVQLQRLELLLEEQIRRTRQLFEGLEGPGDGSRQEQQG